MSIGLESINDNLLDIHFDCFRTISRKKKVYCIQETRETEVGMNTVDDVDSSL
jgi:hypothetical protein